MCKGSRMTQTCAIFPPDVLNRNIIIAKSPTCPSLSSSPPCYRNGEMDVARGKGMSSSLLQIITDCHLLLSPWKAAPRVWQKGLPPSYPVQAPPSNTWALPWLSPTWTRWTWELLLCLWWEYVPPQKSRASHWWLLSRKQQCSWETFSTEVEAHALTEVRFMLLHPQIQKPLRSKFLIQDNVLYALSCSNSNSLWTLKWSWGS